MIMDWDTIEQKLNDFYQRYARSRCARKTSGMGLAAKSARQAYFSSVSEHAHPRRRGFDFVTTEAVIRDISCNVIAPFLENHNYSEERCGAIILAIRDHFQDAEGNYPFSIGNAQKWVNMSFKYYVVHLFHDYGFSAERFFEDEAGCFLLNYPFFPVDSIIERKVSERLGVTFQTQKEWYRRYDLSEFINFWTHAQRVIQSCPSFLWELIQWDNG